MRVIGGSARGRALKAPPRPRASGQPAGLRPTSDLIRGVIFDMLDALGADYTRVLDLYAGTGALGIEALSRGDGTAEFVEIDAAAIGAIKTNLASLKMEDRASIHRIPAERAAAALSGVYSLVLADPPYFDVDAFDAARSVAESGRVDDATVIVVEHSRRVSPPEALGTIPLYRSRRHGDSVVSIYAREEVP
jgi:16S rRNA (guanine(966)-N(2))-methyltransferase RsmD